MTWRQAKSGRYYAANWDAYLKWCGGHDIDPDTTVAVARYLQSLAGRGYAPATVRQHRSAINAMHIAKGLTSPPGRDASIVDFVAQLAAESGSRSKRKMAMPGRAEMLRVLKACDDDKPKDVRDRALLSLAWLLTMSTRKVVALNVAHIEVVQERPFGRLAIRMPGHPRVVLGDRGEWRPVAWLLEWRKVSGIQSGAVFRSFLRGGKVKSSRLLPGHTSTIVKERVAAAGLSPKQFSGLSLRFGHIRSEYQRGRPVDQIKTMANLQSIDRVLRNVS